MKSWAEVVSSLPAHQARRVALGAKWGMLLLALGLGQLALSSQDSWIYAGWGALLAGSMAWLGRDLWRCAQARLRFSSHLRNAIPASGADLTRLLSVGRAIRDNQEDRAFLLLDHLELRQESADSMRTADWLRSLAGIHWMARQTPVRPLSGFYERYPQVHGLLFCGCPQTISLREQLLEKELATISCGELDALARRYIALLDVLVASVGNPRAAFADRSQDLLEFMTGRAYLFGARERLGEWWQRLRPVLQRGGGPLLVGMRLSQHGLYEPARALLSRFAEDGLLSAETETLRRASAFLSLFARPVWRLTSADMARYFEEGFYYLASEMGVLRYPTAELPEVVSCCRHAKVLMQEKKRLIEDSLALWDIFERELSPSLALLLRRLLEVKNRQCPNRVGYWREQWELRRGCYERPAAVLMQGITAVDAKDYTRAEKLFEEAARLEQQSSTPLVNLIYVLTLQRRIDEARALVAQVLKRFPKDGSAMIAMGRLLAMQLKDSAGAEKLFTSALDCIDSPVEALICLGELKFLEAQYMESHEYFNHALQLDPILPDYKLGLAHVYIETKRFDLAILNLEAVLRDGPDEARVRAHYLLYRVYRQTGEDRRAVRHLAQVPSTFFVEPEVLDDIALHLEHEKMYAKAREYAERAMVLRAGGFDSSADPEALSAP